MGGWQVADLRELRPTAAAWELFRSWGGPRVRAWQGYCTVVEAGPWEEVVSSLSKKHRKTVRRALRQADAEGAHWELAEPEASERAAGTLVELNRQQWRDRWQETGPEHWSERFESHIRTAASRMTAGGLGAISELRKDGQTILSTFLLFGGDSVGLYMVGAGDEVLQWESYSTLFVRDMLETAHKRDIPSIDFLNGEDAYKLRWNPKVVPNQQVILGRNPAYWAPYAGYAVLRSWAVRYAMSADSPEWARRAAKDYVRLRYRAARLVGSAKTPRFVRKIAGAWFRWA
jgi:CelD/BcsL family acetyltransferase involved in cellulose biosynthesis